MTDLGPGGRGGGTFSVRKRSWPINIFPPERGSADRRRAPTQDSHCAHPCVPPGGARVGPNGHRHHASSASDDSPQTGSTPAIGPLAGTSALQEAVPPAPSPHSAASSPRRVSAGTTRVRPGSVRHRSLRASLAGTTSTPPISVRSPTAGKRRQERYERPTATSVRNEAKSGDCAGSDRRPAAYRALRRAGVVESAAVGTLLLVVAAVPALDVVAALGEEFVEHVFVRARC